MKNQNAGTKSNAFTLVELLVVIAIIALLMAILVPGLNKAKELANRIVCASHLKTLTQASSTYASTYDGFFVPVGYVGKNSGPLTFSQYNLNNGDTLWMQNKAFKKYIDIEAFNVGSSGDMVSPKEFLCPSDKISRDPYNESQYGVLTSYGYNVTDWAPWSHPLKLVGHRSEVVRNPSEKLQFIDGIDWWVDWNGADYRIGWDIVGPVPSDDFPLNGPTYYRHSDGAVIGFYDGHSQRMDKEDIFVITDYGATPPRAGMWTSTGQLP